MLNSNQQIPYTILFTTGIVALVLINGAAMSGNILLWIASGAVVLGGIYISKEAFLKKKP